MGKRKCLYFLRKLKDFRVSRKIPERFYKSVIENVVPFDVNLFYGNSIKHDLDKIKRTMKQCEKISGNKYMSLDSLFAKFCAAKRKGILSDATYPLHPNYQLLRSGLRFRSLRCCTTRYKCSFVQCSICQNNAESGANVMIVVGRMNFFWDDNQRAQLAVRHFRGVKSSVN